MMKPSLCLVALVVVAGCAAEPEEAPPAPVEVTRLASSLERRLPTPVAAPTETAIGQSIDAVVEARTAALTLTAREPVVDLRANGRRCLVQRFDDEGGKEAMRRETCERDVLRIGKQVLTAPTANGKIEHFADGTGYEVFDDDHDGKVDRVIEAAERMKAPISLADYGPNVSITGAGRIASRTLVDRDHDGKLEVESVTATTSFQIRETAAP